jgi:hypothetical protein
MMGILHSESGTPLGFGFLEEINPPLTGIENGEGFPAFSKR